MKIRSFPWLPVFVLLTLSSATASRGETLVADPNVTTGPSYYRNLLSQLQPGDTLYLPAGMYRDRLNLNGIQGTAAAWISISGPDSGDPAVITTDSGCCNTVQLGDSAYITLKYLTIDSNSESIGVSIDAINAKGQPTHDVLIENCVIKGVGLHQQTVGISTKSMAWNWTIRRNRIIGAGTGIYLGNSTGSAPFIGGIIENNLFLDTIGYNMQIKHQNPYDLEGGIPQPPNRTIIRDNVFLKRVPQSNVEPNKVDGPRPNLLVGGFPDSGPGSSDLYEIYGNFFFQNPDGESLIQASGRTSIHDNVFVGPAWSAIFTTDHNLPVKYFAAYNNTIYLVDNGIRLASVAREASMAVGNLVLSANPISGGFDDQRDNIMDGISAADQYVRFPTAVLGQMDFYPVEGSATGEPLDLSNVSADTDFNLDFNREAKGNIEFRGAYAGEGSNPGWQIDAELKWLADIVVPLPPTNLTTN